MKTKIKHIKSKHFGLVVAHAIESHAHIHHFGQPSRWIQASISYVNCLSLFLVHKHILSDNPASSERQKIPTAQRQDCTLNWRPMKKHRNKMHAPAPAIILQRQQRHHHHQPSNINMTVVSCVKQFYPISMAWRSMVAKRHSMARYGHCHTISSYRNYEYHLISTNAHIFPCCHTQVVFRWIYRCATVADLLQK